MESKPGSQCGMENCTELMNYLPFRCKYCNKTFCKKHRLPENHNCEFTSEPISHKESTKSKNTDELEEVKPEYLYDPTNEIPEMYRDEGDDKEKYSEADLEREMRDYIRQQNHQTSSRSRNVSGVRVEHRSPFVSQARKTKVTYALMAVSLIFTMLSTFFPTLTPFFTINITTIKSAFFIPIFTSMFTSSGIFNMLINLLILFSTARRLEMQFGSKLLLLLYLTGGAIGTATVLLIQGIGVLVPTLQFLYFIIPLESPAYFVMVPLQWCGMTAILAFIIYLAGIDREMRILLYFIPVQMKGRTILLLLIGINAVIAIGGIFMGLFAVGGGMVALSIANITSVFAGKLFYQKYGHQRPVRFF